jgi:hypothetical protein
LDQTAGVNTTGIRRVGVAIDCADAGPVARFYERLLGFEMGDFEPPQRAQLWDPAGGVHLNIQGETSYEPPTWPEPRDGDPVIFEGRDSSWWPVTSVPAEGMQSFCRLFAFGSAPT